MSDNKAPIHTGGISSQDISVGKDTLKPSQEIIDECKTKLGSYQEILKIKQKKFKQKPSVDKLRKMMTQRQFDMLAIKQ